MSSPEYRVALEGRAKWVVRKRHPHTNTWLPVWYAASQVSAVQWVNKQTGDET